MTIVEFHNEVKNLLATKNCADRFTQPHVSCNAATSINDKLNVIYFINVWDSKKYDYIRGKGSSPETALRVLSHNLDAILIEDIKTSTMDIIPNQLAIDFYNEE